MVPLSAPAVQALRDTPRMLGNPDVIASSVAPGRPLVNINQPWQRIRKRAELDDVRLHDLRRTVSSWLATTGSSLPLISKVLNHSNASTTEICARLALSHLCGDSTDREFVSLICPRQCGVVGGTPSRPCRRHGSDISPPPDSENRRGYDAAD